MARTIKVDNPRVDPFVAEHDRPTRVTLVWAGSVSVSESVRHFDAFDLQQEVSVQLQHPQMPVSISDSPRPRRAP